MQNAEVSNPNDFKVVSFHNPTEFGFTPEMGCMYDGRPINGKSGEPGIASGETMVLPYHVGNRLAINLAKRVLNTSQAATVDEKGNPVGKAVWSEDLLQQKARTFIKDLYVEEKAVPQSETEKLLAKVEEYKSMVDRLIDQGPKDLGSTTQNVPSEGITNGSGVYQDKKEVIEELTKRGVKFDARKSKAELEKLIV